MELPATKYPSLHSSGDRYRVADAIKYDSPPGGGPPTDFPPIPMQPASPSLPPPSQITPPVQTPSPPAWSPPPPASYPAPGASRTSVPGPLVVAVPEPSQGANIGLNIIVSAPPPEQYTDRSPMPVISPLPAPAVSPLPPPQTASAMPMPPPAMPARYADGITERLGDPHVRRAPEPVPAEPVEAEEPSPWPEGFSAFNGFQPTPGFTLGRWEFMCVDPTGLRLRRTFCYKKSEKTGGQLNNGDTFIVCERGIEQNMHWLCLADGRGWAFERTDRRRCSEIVYEQLPSSSIGCRHMIWPSYGAALALRSSPFIGKGPSFAMVLPGTIVTMVQKAYVLVQSKGGTEHPRPFLKILVERDIEGWIPEYTEDQHRIVVEFETHEVENMWISIVTRSKDAAQVWPTPGHCGVHQALGRVIPGDIFPVEEVCSVSGDAFYRIPDGGWIAERTPKNEKVCDLVEREEHWWQYNCCDKEGSEIRHAPTRSTAMNTGKRVKYRQRICASEIVKFSSGDAFIHLEPPLDGWVPLTKLGGQKKMHALHPMQPRTGFEKGKGKGMKGKGKGKGKMKGIYGVPPMGMGMGKGMGKGGPPMSGPPMSMPASFAPYPQQPPMMGPPHQPPMMGAPLLGPPMSAPPSYAQRPPAFLPQSGDFGI